jgi:putative transposase
MSKRGLCMAIYRKNPLETGKIYHILNKSIADFIIFDGKSDFCRMLETIKYYQIKNQSIKLSRSLELKSKYKEGKANRPSDLSGNKENLVKIIAYCIMPTHLHLVLEQLQDHGVSIFMSKVQNSYARYFNISRNRKGPLWQGRFKNILVESDDQLYHLTRYIHLNPVTAYLVENPEEWDFSSYKEYLGTREDKICEYDDLFEVNLSSYKEFIENRISDQRELQKIKKIALE